MATANGARPLSRRRSLPGGRAVVGGLLVALAGVGTFAGYTSATADHRVDYVVASRALSVGHRVSAADLTVAPMQLPPGLASRLAYRDPRLLVGSLVVGPVSAGELVQAGDVVAGPPAPGAREMSFAIKTSSAVDGTLVAGDRVDVLATYGSGADADTLAVARAVPVVSVSRPGSGISTQVGQTEVVTLALSNSARTLALAQAVDAGQIVLVRSTGAAPAHDSGSYRTPKVPPAAPAGGSSPTSSAPPASAGGSRG